MTVFVFGEGSGVGWLNENVGVDVLVGDVGEGGNSAAAPAVAMEAAVVTGADVVVFDVEPPANVGVPEGWDAGDEVARVFPHGANMVTVTVIVVTLAVVWLDGVV